MLASFMLASTTTTQIHFIDIEGWRDVQSGASCARARHREPFAAFCDAGTRRSQKQDQDMSSAAGAISLEQDTPELARTYEQAGIVQFHHGKFLIGPLALRQGEHVLDIGAGTGRLAEFVATLVGPHGRVIGIEPLENRVAIARLRQSETLTFDPGRAEDLSRFDDGAFDAVYLNSVFHWIAEKPRTLCEIHRVLRPGGRLGLNVQDPARPHESRTLLRQAIRDAGFGDRKAGSHPVLGVSDEELRAQFTEAGFIDYRSDLRSLVDIHLSVDSLIRWSEASAFGNFLDGFSAAERGQVRLALAHLLDAKRTSDGLRVERYLRFAFARKPAATRNGQA
jgi:arsenite methyltransferase